MKYPKFSVLPTSDSKEDKEKAEIMEFIIDRLIPPSRREEILHQAMMHTMTCQEPDHKLCQGLIEYKWEPTPETPEERRKCEDVHPDLDTEAHKGYHE